MAAEEGFEPSHTASESAVLPLHNSATTKDIISKFRDLSIALCKNLMSVLDNDYMRICKRHVFAGNLVLHS